MTEPATKNDDHVPFVGDVVEKPQHAAADDDGTHSSDDWLTVESTFTTSREDDEEEEDHQEEATSTASKNLQEGIRIVHELLPGPTVVPITVDHSDDVYPNSQEFLGNLSTRMEPVQKGLEENVQKLQGAVKPHVEKAMAALDEHVKPHVDKLGKEVSTKWKDISTQTTKGWEQLGDNTQKVMQEHVQPGLQNLRRSTVEGLDHTGKFVMETLPEHSKRALDVHVVPAWNSFQQGTTQTVSKISESTRDTYKKKLAPLLESKYAKYYLNTAPALFTKVEESSLTMILVESTLRSSGRVIMCDNPVTGGCIWFAILISSPLTALCALVSVLSVSGCAKYLELDPTELRKGHIGMNALLVGAGCASFFQFFENAFGQWVGLMVLSGIILPPMTLLSYLHTTRTWLPNTPPLLMPYNLVMICMLLSAMMWDRTMIVSTQIAAEEATGAIYSVFAATLNGLAAIFLVEGVASGLFILIGVTLCSRILATALVVGSLLASLLGLLFDMHAADLNAGIAGYNPALTAAALMYYFEPTGTEAFVGFFAILMTCILQAAVGSIFFNLFGLSITLTLGYCLATLPILSLSETSFGRRGILQRIPKEQLSTPELYLASLESDYVSVDDVEESSLWFANDIEGNIEEVVGNKGESIAKESTPLFAGTTSS